MPIWPSGWAMGRMSPASPGCFTGVAAAYVPAVDGLDFRMYANDTEVHRTPS